MSKAVIRLSSRTIGAVAPGKHVGKATIVPSRVYAPFRISSAKAMASGEFESALVLACGMFSSLPPHPHGPVRIHLRAVRRHAYFENARWAVANMAEEEVAFVVHRAPRNVLSGARGMFQTRHLLALQRVRVQPPHHALPAHIGRVHRVVDRVAPA